MLLKLAEWYLEYLIFKINIKNKNKINKIWSNFNHHISIIKLLKLMIAEEFDLVIIIHNKIHFYLFEIEKDL